MRHDVSTRLRARRTAAAPRFVEIVGLALILLTLSACSPAGPAASNVQVTSPTVAAQGQLALHATATFEVAVQDPNGLHQAEDLRYHWSVDEERGTYLLDGGEEATEAATTSSSLQLRGDVAGAETVRVTVVDASTDTTVGVGTLAFDITSPSATSLCFDATTLLVAYGYGQWYTDTIDLETGERTTVAYALVTDISPDGNWLTGVQSADEGRSRIFIQRCDRSGYRTLTNGEHYEESPKFAPDGRSIYFRRRTADENVLYPGEGLPGFPEVAVVDVATGVSSVLTSFNAAAEGVHGGLAIAPDGETLAFVRFKAAQGGSAYARFVYDFDLVTMPAGGGPLQSLTSLGDHAPTNGIDWSPDGGDIIFSWEADNQSEPARTGGIYRIHPTAGGGPQLIFTDPSPQSLAPMNTTYYAGGTRIAWSGQEYGDSTAEVWSIDANGADVQRLTDDVGSARLMAIWEPY